jgi:hypothetical protein
MFDEEVFTMKTYTARNPEKSRRSTESISKPQKSDEVASQLVDNRVANVAQRQLADVIHSSPKQVAQRQQLSRLFGNAAQLQSMDEDELQMKKDSAALQRMGEEEEELLQGQFETLQRQGDLEEEDLLQGKFETVQKQENKTGLPDNLKSGMENLTGQSLDHVKVHYNSPKPAAVQAHAYAQGSDIHLASGQEKHLPHELGHVVQQAQGRVKPTTSVAGMQVNDNPGLENEATSMGEKAMQLQAVRPESIES